MKNEIMQVTISMIVKGEKTINQLKNAGIQVLLETSEMIAASNRDAVQRKGEKFSSRLGEGKQGRVDTAGRIILDGGKCITPGRGIEFVSPKRALEDLEKFGFSLFDVYLKIKEGDTENKGFFHVKFRRGENAKDDPIRINGYKRRLIASIASQTYAKMTGFHNQPRIYETPPRWYRYEPENLTFNFVAFAVTKPEFRRKHEHKFKILKITEENEYYTCPSTKANRPVTV